MYIKQIKIVNYGPIENLDIEFPFDGANRPKPVVLVGKNGSGKSLLLSHIINGLIIGKGKAYPESPETKPGEVYKLRGPSYITAGKEFSFTQVNFDDLPPILELILCKRKGNFAQVPDGIAGADAKGLYDSLGPGEYTKYDCRLTQGSVKTILEENCVLYFPPDRFEDPAWLNESNLKSKAQYMDPRRLDGYSDRPIINHAPLNKNRNWLFELVYDWCVFDRYVAPTGDTKAPTRVVYRGPARDIYDNVLLAVRKIMNRGDNLRLGIGPRHDRDISVMMGDQAIVPNIFHLSSGETSLLNLFLSIIRDYDLTRAQFKATEDIRGIVVVDEIDLHLHTVHQYEILPSLIKRFPNVQFVVTSHSPLFLLGLQRVLGEDGFGVYSLPRGERISPDEFSEFGEVYQAFAATRRHMDAIRDAIRDAQKPLVFVEGETDRKYMEAAAKILGLNDLGNQMEFRSIGGGGKEVLKTAWRGITKLNGMRQSVVFLHDCDTGISDRSWPKSDPRAFRRMIKKVKSHPLQKGIENLFSRETLERAMKHKVDFIDVDEEHRKTTRGQKETVPEQWTVNEDEKTNLCNWFCKNGTPEDFQHFVPIFKMLQKTLNLPSEVPVQAGGIAEAQQP